MVDVVAALIKMNGTLNDLKDLELGIYNAHWKLAQQPGRISEAEVFAADMASLGLPQGEAEAKLMEWLALNASVYIPTFYAFGRK